MKTKYLGIIWFVYVFFSLEIYSANTFIYIFIFTYIEFYSLQMSLRTKLQEQISVFFVWALKGELTKKFLFLFSLDQVSSISLLKYFPPKMSLT